MCEVGGLAQLCEVSVNGIYQDAIHSLLAHCTDGLFPASYKDPAKLFLRVGKHSSDKVQP